MHLVISAGPWFQFIILKCVCVCVFLPLFFPLSLPDPDFFFLFLGSVWSYLCEHVPVFVCVPLALSLCIFGPHLEASRSSYSNTIA